VGKPLLDQPSIMHLGVDRKKLDGGDPQTRQMIEDRLREQAEIATTNLFRYLGMETADALYVGVVDDGILPRTVWSTVITPLEVLFDDRSERRVRGAALPTNAQSLLIRLQLIAEETVVPRERAPDRRRVRVEEDLVRIESMPLL